MKAKWVEPSPVGQEQDENVLYFRHLRETRDQKFKTVEGLFAHLDKVARQRKKESAKSRRAKASRAGKTESVPRERVARKIAG